MDILNITLVDKKIRRRVAFKNRRHGKAFRPESRDILHTVDSKINLACEDGIVQRPDKDTLPADLMHRHLRPVIAHCLYLGDLRLNAQLSQLSADTFGLRYREAGTPCPYNQRHAAYAPAIVATSSSECATERKLVSNCDGGRNMPFFIILFQNTENAFVSLSFASR